MSKNMTKKGLALGAASALVVAGFSALPANAAGLADTSFVSLTPTTGTEYTVLASDENDGATFSLTANEAATVSTGDLKFLVTDPNSLVEPLSTSTSRILLTTDNANDTIQYVDADNIVKFTDNSENISGLAVGDQISFNANLTVAGPKILATAGEVYNVTDVTGKVISFTTDTDGDAAAAGNIAATEALITTNPVISVVREARTTTGALAGTYVVDSGVSSAATDEVLVLETDSNDTRSVTVQAWMDANGNDKIDSTEYASPERTITWKKASEVVSQTTLAPVVGDTALNAVITTTPVLNGEQTLAFNPVAINAAFTRSLSTSTAYADNTDTSGATANTSSVWNDTNKTFTVSVNTDADNANEASNAAGADVADAWATLAAPTAGGTILESIQISTTGLVTALTDANHGLVSGDKITMTIDADTAVAFKALAAETAATVTVTGARSFTYQVSETTGLPTTATAVLVDVDEDDYVVVTYAGNTGLVDRVGAETYTAQATVAGALNGAKVSTGVSSAVAATTTVSTAASSTVQGSSYSAVAANVTKVLAGTLSVPVTITVTDAKGVAVGAGRAVELTLASVGTANTVRVNGKTADTVLTDANGQVTATVTVSTGVDGVDVTLTAQAENIASADIDLQWEAAAYGLVNLNGTGGTLADNSTTNLDIIKLGSYTLDLMVADQWFNVPTDGTYRLRVLGEGVDARYVSLVDGRATVTATDTGVFGSSMDADVIVEKLAADGVTVASDTTHNFNANLSTAYKVNIGATGTTLYGNTVVTSVAVAKKALVEIDKRTSAVATPAYANNLVLNGSVVESATSAGKVGATVTVSGPSNILFEEGNVAKRGSLTFNTGANGLFEVKAYSTTAQAATEITFTTSDGATGTIDVTFTGQSIGEATTLEIVAADFVSQASTFQVKAVLTDEFGNGVSTGTSDALKLTKTGAGITFGTLPNDTDVNGEATFNVLLGANDSGTITITASYDQNDDGDFKDTKDITVTKTITIGEAPADTKVNAGSFKGFVAVYAKGYEGQRLSAKIGNDWVIVPALASDFERVVDFTGAGVDIAVRIYIDRVLIDTINLTTK